MSKKGETFTYPKSSNLVFYGNYDKKMKLPKTYIYFFLFEMIVEFFEFMLDEVNKLNGWFVRYSLSKCNSRNPFAAYVLVL